eukprot:COSAG06_NODE_25416_length_637_cov_1.574349_1_plen_184_part_00
MCSRSVHTLNNIPVVCRCPPVSLHRCRGRCRSVCHHWRAMRLCGGALRPCAVVGTGDHHLSGLVSESGGGGGGGGRCGGGPHLLGGIFHINGGSLHGPIISPFRVGHRRPVFGATRRGGAGGGLLRLRWALPVVCWAWYNFCGEVRNSCTYNYTSAIYTVTLCIVVQCCTGLYNIHSKHSVYI